MISPPLVPAILGGDKPAAVTKAIVGFKQIQSQMQLLNNLWLCGPGYIGGVQQCQLSRGIY